MAVDLRGIREGVRTPFADAAESGKPATKARRRPPQEEPSLRSFCTGCL